MGPPWTPARDTNCTGHPINCRLPRRPAASYCTVIPISLRNNHNLREMGGREGEGEGGRGGGGEGGRGGGRERGKGGDGREGGGRERKERGKGGEGGRG